MHVDQQGYITYQVRTTGRKPTNSKSPKRNWWLVKYKKSNHTQTEQVWLGGIYVPMKYIGKKVRFKIETYNPEIAREEKTTL